MTAAHWDAVYSSKAADEVSWFQREPEVSLRLLQAALDGRPGRVVDVGAGASVLGDRLVATGWQVTLLDVSAEALAGARARLGDGATYVVADVLDWDPTEPVDAWHDRAVFHFLTDAADRSRYTALATRAVRTGGVVVLGAFAEDGPEQCSGLPTTRWSAAGLAAAFGAGWSLERSEREEHTTPWGAVQPFTWVVLRRG